MDSRLSVAPAADAAAKKPPTPAAKSSLRNLKGASLRASIPPPTTTGGSRPTSRNGASASRPVSHAPSIGVTGPTPASSVSAPAVANGNNTLAQLHAVFGLPKDPSCWTLAEDDCVAGVHHVESAVGRFWRPEVLGSSVSSAHVPGGGADAAGSGGKTGKDDDKAGGTRKPPRKTDPRWIEMSDGRGGCERVETAKVLAKALKHSFTREVEVVCGPPNYSPVSTSHTFSFSVPVTRIPSPVSGTTTTASVDTNHLHPSSAAGSGGQRTLSRRPSSLSDGRKAASRLGLSISELQDIDKAQQQRQQQQLLQQHQQAGFVPWGPSSALATSAGDLADPTVTFYGVTLLVWSAADDSRAQAVRKELERAARQHGAGVPPSPIIPGYRGRRGGGGGGGGTGRGGGGMYGMSGGGPDEDAIDWEQDELESEGAIDSNPPGGPLAFLGPNTTFYLPYAICLVSRHPLYNLLGDWNKAAWFRYSRNIEWHNRLMSVILNHHAPRPGETIRLDAGPDDDIDFLCSFPGGLEWNRGLINVDFPMWPVFKMLSVDNLLLICEIALAPFGRVLFLSRHPSILGMTVETVRYILEMRGWRGIVHQNAHARDVRIFLEDPGSWLIAVNTELRSIAKPPLDVAVVDIDLNFVNCPRMPPGVPAGRSARDRAKKRLNAALGWSGPDYAPPREFIEAYPAGRFRPVSKIVVKGRDSAREKLEPPAWWDQGQVLATFDKVLQDIKKPSRLRSIFSKSSSRTPSNAHPDEAAVLALRKRASFFVDARDGLENKIGRLNKRLAFLISESEMWKVQFERIQHLVDRLTGEANDLRNKVDKERRESRRLSGMVTERDLQHVQLQMQLKDTENAREEARRELMTMQERMDALEIEREAMMDEIRAVISGGTDDLNLAIQRLDVLSDIGSRPGSRTSRRGSIGSRPGSRTDAAGRFRGAVSPAFERGRAVERIAESSTEALVRPRRSMSADDGPMRGSRRNSLASVRRMSVSSIDGTADDALQAEISLRTSVVSDQITRLQRQLESTLINLEERRSIDNSNRRNSIVSVARSERSVRSPGEGEGGGGGGAARNSAGTEDEEIMADEDRSPTSPSSDKDKPAAKVPSRVTPTPPSAYRPPRYINNVPKRQSTPGRVVSPSVGSRTESRGEAKRDGAQSPASPTDSVPPASPAASPEPVAVPNNVRLSAFMSPSSTDVSTPVPSSPSVEPDRTPRMNQNNSSRMSIVSNYEDARSEIARYYDGPAASVASSDDLFSRSSLDSLTYGTGTGAGTDRPLGQEGTENDDEMSAFGGHSLESHHIDGTGVVHSASTTSTFRDASPPPAKNVGLGREVTLRPSTTMSSMSSDTTKFEPIEQRTDSPTIPTVGKLDNGTLSRSTSAETETTVA